MKAFEKVDAIISPTSPEPAFKIGERTANPLAMYLADIFTNTANLAGICGISVPCGFAKVNGSQLPIGLQILGKALDEARIFQIAHAYEQSTDWHKQQPKEIQCQGSQSRKLEPKTGFEPVTYGLRNRCSTS